MDSLTPTLHPITVDNRHIGSVDLAMLRRQIAVLSRLAGQARDDDYDDLIGILATLEAVVQHADPAGNDPSFDLSRCPRCDQTNVVFEGARVDAYGASRRFYCRDCDAEGHIQFVYNGHWIDGEGDGEGRLVLFPPQS